MVPAFAGVERCRRWCSAGIPRAVFDFPLRPAKMGGKELSARQSCRFPEADLSLRICQGRGPIES